MSEYACEIMQSDHNWGRGSVEGMGGGTEEWQLLCVAYLKIVLTICAV